jgi:hypothetical protein
MGAASQLWPITLRPYRISRQGESTCAQACFAPPATAAASL